MVNTLLVVVCGLSLVVWLVQEQVAGRPAEQEPGWSRLAYRLVLAAWLIWLAAAVWIKDGDFAFVLVMLTLLAGVIVLLDRLWFARRRAGRREEGARAEPREIAEHARSFFPVLLVVLVLRSFIVEPFQIPSSSMEPPWKWGITSWSTGPPMACACRYWAPRSSKWESRDGAMSSFSSRPMTRVTSSSGSSACPETGWPSGTRCSTSTMIRRNR